MPFLYRPRRIGAKGSPWPPCEPMHLSFLRRPATVDQEPSPLRSWILSFSRIVENARRIGGRDVLRHRREYPGLIVLQFGDRGGTRRRACSGQSLPWYE